MSFVSLDIHRERLGERRPRSPPGRGLQGASRGHQGPPGAAKGYQDYRGQQLSEIFDGADQAPQCHRSGSVRTGPVRTGLVRSVATAIAMAMPVAMAPRPKSQENGSELNWPPARLSGRKEPPGRLSGRNDPPWSLIWETYVVFCMSLGTRASCLT